jgi:hypothetical protein
VIKRFGLAVLLGIAWISTGLAQTYPTQQQFRDPATGKIWTPENVGGVSGPNTPQDRAFNPQAQTTAVPGTTVQVPRVTLLGSVPITAGPTVPIAVLDNAALSAIPGQSWQIVLYLNNNSALTINPVIDCRFTNAGAPVENVRANLPPIAGGQRVGLTINGPQTTLFVDRAECGIASM